MADRIERRDNTNMNQVKYIDYHDEGRITVLVKHPDESGSRRIGHIRKLVHVSNGEDVHECEDDLIQWLDGRSSCLNYEHHRALLAVIKDEIMVVLSDDDALEKPQEGPVETELAPKSESSNGGHVSKETWYRANELRRMHEYTWTKVHEKLDEEVHYVGNSKNGHYFKDTVVCVTGSSRHTAIAVLEARCEWQCNRSNKAGRKYGNDWYLRRFARERTDEMRIHIRSVYGQGLLDLMDKAWVSAKDGGFR